MYALFLVEHNKKNLKQLFNVFPKQQTHFIFTLISPFNLPIRFMNKILTTKDKMVGIGNVLVFID